MGFFKRKKDLDDDFLIIDDELYESAKKAAEHLPKSHSLTQDEIIGNEKTETTTEGNENPLEALRKKMQKTALKDEAPSPFFNIDDSFLTEETMFVSENTETKVETIEELPEEKEDSATEIPEIPLKEDADEEVSFSAVIEDFIGDFKEEKKEKPVEITEIPEERTVEETVEEEQEESLLENCLPFIMDGNNGEFVPDDKPSYTLDSVASILGLEEEEETPEEGTKEDTKQDAQSTMVFSAIKEAQSVPDISDIDNFAKNSPTQVVSFTGTMPVVIPDEMINSTKEVAVPKEIAEATRPAALSMNEETVEEEYRAYKPDFEYNNTNDKKKIKSILLNQRRKRFINFLGTFFSFLFIGFFALPVFSDMKLSFNVPLAVFSSIAFLTALILNADLLISFKTLFTKRTSAEAGIALSVILCLILVILSFIKKVNGNVYYSATLLTTLSLVFRSYFAFSKSQYVYKNFTKISGEAKKYGITLIDDAPTTFAMAKNAIDGDVLIAAPRPVKNVTDFIKNSYFDVDFDGRAKLIFYIGLIFSLLVGVALGFYKADFMRGATAVCAFAALFAPLTCLACSVLPLSNAASHLSRYGAALTSIRSAKKIEQANACVIDSQSLFPKGTIKLSNMKVINENNLEETIACACAITETVNSPLAPIFRNIMETNKAVKTPVADSIKYEDRLGIAGWVGNKRIYIGNRALMLAHEIKVPDAENDKKLMRDGYFPVYVALDTKICALLVLKYIPNHDIAKELDRISAMGLTILVNNCDQNISEEMICDYFDLYSDSVKIMSSSGVHMYRNAANFQENMNAGAVVKSGAAGMAATVYCANRVKKSNTLLQICHMLSIVLGIVIFCYIIFGTAGYVNLVYVCLYQILCFVLSFIAFLFTKP